MDNCIVGMLSSCPDTGQRRDRYYQSLYRGYPARHSRYLRQDWLRLHSIKPLQCTMQAGMAGSFLQPRKVIIKVILVPQDMLHILWHLHLWGLVPREPIDAALDVGCL